MGQRYGQLCRQNVLKSVGSLDSLTSNHPLTVFRSLNRFDDLEHSSTIHVQTYTSLPAAGTVQQTQLDCHLRFRRYLGNFLTFTGIVLTLGTLSLNASKDFVKTANEHNFPPSETAGWQISV
jgi:hypothetical protein